MSNEPDIQEVHQLVEDYTNRRLSMADYRLRRQALLLEIDARINGVDRPSVAEPEDRLITVRKHH